MWQKGCTSNILIYISYLMYPCLVFQGYIYGSIKIIHPKKPLIFSCKGPLLSCSLPCKKLLREDPNYPVFFSTNIMFFYFTQGLVFWFFKIYFSKNKPLQKNIGNIENYFTSLNIFYVKLQRISMLFYLTVK